MDTELGRNMILWTVRLSVALYVLAVWRCVSAVPFGVADRRQTVAWSLSWLLCMVHVMCAYHFEHHWSQQAALKHTAEMTERVVGIDWGGGLYINFLFLGWWGVDVYRLIRRRTQRTAGILQGAAAFMMFNATVVFGPPWWIIPTVVFACAATVRFRHRASQQSNDAV
ncbi:MAG TPA: hypothetical protein EYG03_30175 [Planctomycetes bacterium]|nr:hypothetical protein [Planctomycetota bacterium]